MKIIQKSLAEVVIILTVMACLIVETGEGNESPFYPGEKMAFKVRWSGILAGEAFIELLPVEDFYGVDAYHFVFTARTSPFVDIFYKVRDRIDSYTAADMSHSLLYIKRHEARSKKETAVQFNWEKQEATYSTSDGERRDPISVMPGTFDPLSVFYAFRLQDLNDQVEYGIPLTDGKKCIIGKAKVIRRERIKVSDISYDTFLVEPEMEQVGGVFEKSKDAKLQIWVSADDRHIPLRIKSKVAVGSFVAELASVEYGLPAIGVIEQSPKD